MKRIWFLFVLPTLLLGQNQIIIDGNFDDWNTVPVAVTDPADDAHDTDGYESGKQPAYRTYSDVDILEVKFTNDEANLYGYIKATGEIGRTSSDTLGHAKSGRYYFIFTIDVDDNDTTGYPLREGGYYPDSRGYDMNMEVEFYNGGYNTGHYINHEFLSEQQMQTQGIQDLANGIIQFAPGTYDYYTQWVTFEDSSYVLVEDRGPVLHGIVTIAVSEDGHEAEIKAPMWGFLRTPEGMPVIATGKEIVVSASLEASGELSEEAAKLGYTPGSKSVWGSDTAEPFRYYIAPNPVSVAEQSTNELPGIKGIELHQNYPNPFNPSTKIAFTLPSAEYVDLFVINLLGEKVVQLYQGDLMAGKHIFTWQAQTQSGLALPTGNYYVVLNAGTFQLTRPMVLLR